MHLVDALIQSDLHYIQAIIIIIFISLCVPWELNPQPFALLMQCSTTEPQEHIVTYKYTRDVTRSCGTRSRELHWSRDNVMISLRNIL